MTQRILHIIIASLCALLIMAGCGSDKKPETFAKLSQELCAIDSLMQSSPDSALQTLLSCHSEYEVRGTSLNYNDSYRYLLLSEALYKTDNPQYYRNELQTAMQYFDSIVQRYPANDDLTVLSARSHYMNGVGFYENDSVVDACKEYLHTLEIMENHFDVEKLRGYKAKLMGLTYNRLAELFSDRFMIELSLYCDKQALLFCKLIPTSKYSVPNILFRIGKKYDMSQQADSAFLYYNLALESLPDSNNVVFRDISTHLYLMSYSMDSETDNHLCDLKRIIELADDKNEMLTRYVAAGYIHYKEECYDSAACCFGKVFENKTDDVARITSAKYLYDIYLVNGDTMSANKYAAFLADHATYRYDDMIEVSTLDNLFNDYLKKQQYNKHNHIFNILLKRILIFFAIILMLILIIASLKYRKTVQEAKRAEKKLIDLKKKYGQQCTESENKLLSYLNEPICKKIIGLVDHVSLSSRESYVNYPNIWLDDETITVFIETTTKHFPDLKAQLITKNKQIKQEDLLLCYLSLIGLNFAQIAVLMKYSYSSIRKRSLRLQKSLQSDLSIPNYIKRILYLE